jgi:hypothetical protein
MRASLLARPLMDARMVLDLSGPVGSLTGPLTFTIDCLVAAALDVTPCKDAGHVVQDIGG